jgi:hypothetical protein
MSVGQCPWRSTDGQAHDDGWMTLDGGDCRVTGHYDLKRRSLRSLSPQAAAFQAVVFPSRTNLLGRRDSDDDFWLKIPNQSVNLALFPLALSAQVW